MRKFTFASTLVALVIVVASYVSMPWAGSTPQHRPIGSVSIMELTRAAGPLATAEAADAH